MEQAQASCSGPTASSSSEAHQCPSPSSSSPSESSTLSTPRTGSTGSTLLHLKCAHCGLQHDADQLHRVCSSCQKPLLAIYDLSAARRLLTPQVLAQRRDRSMWRYKEVLPVRSWEKVVTLGEGGTPLMHCERLGRRIGCVNTYIKNEALNPTGSFKARGLCLAVSKAYELGVTSIAVPSAGNAAGAMSAYAAACGMKAHVFMPSDVPLPFRVECKVQGAEVTLVDGLITHCGAKVEEGVKAGRWFAASTLKEPYRVEGKKTMAYEIAEEMGWTLPDVFIYPTGGGTGLIGMWKAFDEMEQMGLIGSQRPRMVAVQSSGCAPIVRAFNENKTFATLWENAKTVADGLRVPSALGDFLILQAIKESNGTAIAVPDQDMLEACNLIGEMTGVFAAPEGGACLAAQMKLLAEGWIKPHESVVLFNTGTGLKYAHCWNQDA